MSDWLDSGVSQMAGTLRGSSILAIAGQVRALVASGKQVSNLTIGDFEPKEYPLPKKLVDGTIDALHAGHSNYPPANGILELRTAVQAMYKDRCGLDIALDRILIAGGARPLLYGAYRAIVNPGEKVLYSVPSWNNNHYVHQVGGVPVEIEVGPEDNFFPRLEAIAPHLKDAALIVLNSPQNPSGTCIDEATLKQVCDAIVAENDRRKTTGQRPLMMIYDQIYWMLTFGDTQHVDPLRVHPGMADYVVYIDGISKAFAATGLRVGWSIGPARVIEAMNKVIGHVGAWAPKPEQVATAHLLRDAKAVDEYLAFIRNAAETRLTMLYKGIGELAKLGLPVRALQPQGAIYLSAEFALRGWRDGDMVLNTSDDVRKWLLDEVGFAIVPFDAFGTHDAQDWYRLSVGAISVPEIEALLGRLAKTLPRLKPPA